MRGQTCAAAGGEPPKQPPASAEVGQLQTCAAASSPPMAVAFVGGGHMAAALAGGLCGRAALLVVDRNADKRADLARRFGAAVSADIGDVYGSDVVILAVRPAQMRGVCEGLDGGRLRCVVSVAAGVKVAAIRRWIGAGEYVVVRAMPNTPAQVGLGMTLCYTDSAGEEASKSPPAHEKGGQSQTFAAANTADYPPSPMAAPAQSGCEQPPTLSRGDQNPHYAGAAVITRIMRGVGDVAWLAAEGDIDLATAVSGSGPAYIYYFIEGMRRAAAEMGLDDALSMRLILQTVRGAAEMTAQSAHSPAELARQVAVRGGATERALAVFERADLHQTIAEGMKACAARAKEMGE